jgi:hypothetical protein
MNDNIFNQDDLRVCAWQYTIRHKKSMQFIVGEKVFLKSNPEKPMVIYCIDNDNVIVTIENEYGDYEYLEFPPECLLQYSYAGLITFKSKIKICIN